MEKIIWNVIELLENDRSATEKLVDHEVTSDQQLVIVAQYKNGNILASDSETSPYALPE